MKYILLFIVIIIFIMIAMGLASCSTTRESNPTGVHAKHQSGGKYKGWRFYEDKSGNLIPVCRCKRKSFTH